MLEHLIGLVKNHGLEGREIDVSSLNVVKHAAAGTHEEIDTMSQGPGLVVDVDTTIDSQ